MQAIVTSLFTNAAPTDEVSIDAVLAYYKSVAEGNLSNKGRLFYFSTGAQDNRARVPEGLYLKCVDSRQRRFLIPMQKNA